MPRMWHFTKFQGRHGQVAFNMPGQLVEFLVTPLKFGEVPIKPSWRPREQNPIPAALRAATQEFFLSAFPGAGRRPTAGAVPGPNQFGQAGGVGTRSTTWWSRFDQWWKRMCRRHRGKRKVLSTKFVPDDQGEGRGHDRPCCCLFPQVCEVQGSGPVTALFVRAEFPACRAELKDLAAQIPPENAQDLEQIGRRPSMWNLPERITSARGRPPANKWSHQPASRPL